MESYGTHLGTSNSQKKISPSSAPKRKKKNLASCHWLGEISIPNCVGHHFWPRLTTRGMNSGGTKLQIECYILSIVNSLFLIRIPFFQKY
jgi:hypothetical protein